MAVLTAGMAARPVFLSSPTRIAAAVTGVVLLLKLVAVALYVSGTRSIFDLGFSIDPYMKSLYEGKGYIGCEDFGCHRASRMPGVPYFLYWMTFLTLNYKVAAYLKAVLLAVPLFFTVRVAAREVQAPTPRAFAISAFLVGFLVFAPNLVKHTSVLHYEEGYLIEIVAMVGVLFFVMLRRGAAGFSFGIAAAMVVLAALAYLIKSSQVLVLAAVALAAIVLAMAAGRRIAAAALLVLALVAPLGWGTHNLVVTKRFSVMSSYDGENMYRGWNDLTMKLHPRCSLDVIFSGLDVCMGEKLNLPRQESRHFYRDDEWAWNDAYKARAMAWIRDNPVKAAQTFALKFATFVAWPRMVPYVLFDGNDYTEERFRKPFEEIAVGAWLTIGRLIEFCGLVLVVLLLRRGDARARVMASGAFLLMACYGAPYILGFGVERHFSIFVMLGAIATLFLHLEWLRVRGVTSPR